MKKRVPVIYIGRQVGATDDEYLDLVDEPGGFTKVFDPAKHVIVGVSERAKNSLRLLTNDPSWCMLKLQENKMEKQPEQKPVERKEERPTEQPVEDYKVVMEFDVFGGYIVKQRGEKQ